LSFCSEGENDDDPQNWPIYAHSVAQRLLNAFCDFEASEKSVQTGEEAAFAAACAIGDFTGLHGQKRIKKFGFAWVKI
jgi:ribosomal protein S5